MEMAGEYSSCEASGVVQGVLTECWGWRWEKNAEWGDLDEIHHPWAWQYMGQRRKKHQGRLLGH